ncbi:MAG: hypothetical protein AAFX78_08305 [Cyanobacteria bacterium J06638_20]
MPGHCRTAHNLWVALGTLITTGHPFYRRSVAAIAQEVYLVPLYVETVQGTQPRFNLLNHVLEAQDVLYLTIPAHKLEAL